MRIELRELQWFIFALFSRSREVKLAPTYLPGIFVVVVVVVVAVVVMVVVVVMVEVVVVVVVVRIFLELLFPWYHKSTSS